MFNSNYRQRSLSYGKDLPMQMDGSQVKAVSQQHQTYLDGFSSSPVQMPCSFFLSKDSDPRLNSNNAPESSNRTSNQFQSGSNGTRALDFTDNTDNNPVSPTKSHMHTSDYTILTDEDIDLSSQASSSCSLDDSWSDSHMALSYKSTFKMNSESFQPENRRQPENPPTLSGASSVFTDQFDYNNIDASSFEHLSNFNSYHLDRDQSHLPSHSISNSATFARALKNTQPSNSTVSNSLNVSENGSLKVTPKGKRENLIESVKPPTDPATGFTNFQPFASPKLVMPKVFLPTRRPFTTDGLALGKLKILVTGDSGTGKSMLIKAIAQASQGIVYIDDIPSFVKESDVLWEQAASTKPCLNFHKSFDFEDTETSMLESLYDYSYNVIGPDQKPRAQHPSVTQPSTVSSESCAFEKNVCFVDTLGYGSFTDASRCIEKVISYLDMEFQKTSDLVNANNPEAVNLLTYASSIKSVPMVDVCLYTITNRLKTVDIEYIRQISRYTPVIPIISRSDLLPPKEVLMLKLSILQDLKKENVIPFLFETSIDEAIDLAKKNLIKYMNEPTRRHSSVASVGTLRASQSFGQKPRLQSRSKSETQHRASGFVEPLSYYPGSDNEDVLDSDSSTDPSEPKSGFAKALLFPCAVSSVSESGDCHISINDSAVLINSDLSFVFPESASKDITPEQTGLFPSELETLCLHLFSIHGATWLRHSAAKRFLDWHEQNQFSQTLIECPQVKDTLKLSTMSAAHRARAFEKPESSPKFFEHIERDTDDGLENFTKSGDYISNQRPKICGPEFCSSVKDFGKLEKLLNSEALDQVKDTASKHRKQAQRNTSKWVMDLVQSDGAVCFAVPYKPAKLIQSVSKSKMKTRRPYNGYKGSGSRQEWQMIPVFLLSTPRPTVPPEVHKRFKKIETFQDLNKFLSLENIGADSLIGKNENRQGYRKAPKGSISKHSNSITDTDPLNLWGIAAKLWNFTFKAIGMAFGFELLVKVFFKVFDIHDVLSPFQLLGRSPQLFQSLSILVVGTVSLTVSKFGEVASLLLGSCRAAFSLLMTPFGIGSLQSFQDTTGSSLEIEKESLKTKSLLSAFFSGELEDNVFMVLLKSLGNGLSRLI